MQARKIFPWLYLACSSTGAANVIWGAILLFGLQELRGVMSVLLGAALIVLARVLQKGDKEHAELLDNIQRIETTKQNLQTLRDDIDRRARDFRDAGRFPLLGLMNERPFGWPLTYDAFLTFAIAATASPTIVARFTRETSVSFEGLRQYAENYPHDDSPALYDASRWLDWIAKTYFPEP